MLVRFSLNIHNPIKFILFLTDTARYYEHREAEATKDMIIFLENALRAILTIVPVLIAVAYFTLFERKVIASMQRRRGPNVVGFFGLLQPLADGLKLLLKETVLPSSANLATFVAAPIITFTLSLVG